MSVVRGSAGAVRRSALRASVRGLRGAGLAPTLPLLAAPR
jgi:hypothetical protein